MIRTIFSRLAGLLGQSSRDADLDDEVRAHLELLAADHERRGLSPDEARFAARRAFGGVESMKERYRDRVTWSFVPTLIQDVRHAWRSLVRSPYFTIPVALSLALAIGANVAAFSLVNTLVLKPLPVSEPDRLFHLTYVDETRVSEGGNYSWFELVRDRARSVSSVFIAHRRGAMKVIVEGDVEALGGLQASGEYFESLGIVPQAGRLIVPADEEVSTPSRVAVLSDSYWSRRFARDPAVIGRTIRVDDVPHVVIGITPPEFFGIEVGRRVDVTVPIDRSEYRQGWVTMALIVRLRPDVAPSAAAAELTGLLHEFAGTSGPRARLREQQVELAPMRTGIATQGTTRDRLTRPAVIASVVIGLMLLLASTNWAMLLLARASARRREVAVRLALGSTRVRVARQTVAESVLLAIVGGLLGFGVATWSVEYLPGNLLPPDLRIESDLRVLSFALGVALMTGVLFSIAPVWLTRRISVDDLRATAGSHDRHGLRIGRALIVAQVALSVIVVAAAGLFGATLRNLRSQDMGFHGNGVVTFSLDADGTGIEGEALRSLHGRVLERLNGIPDVRSATLASVSPLSGNEDGKGITVPGFTPRNDGDLMVNVNTVAPAYFATFGIPVLRGRPITADDTPTSQHVALISESAARFYFAGQNPIGRRLQIRGATTLNPEIIGLVPDVMYGDLRSGAERMFYVPFAQRPAEGEYVFAVRTAEGREASVLRQIPSVVRGLAPDMPVLDLTTLSRQIDTRAANERLLASLSGLFGALALVLAGIGIFGIVSYTVSRRMPELGVRMALGASSGHVLAEVLRETALVTGVGIAIGVVAAVHMSGMVTGVVFGVSPGDPRVYAAAAAVLLSTAMVAAARPVVRALRIRPVDALRSE
jgi:predicted permease